MYLIKAFILFLLFTFTLYADSELKKEYFVSDHNIRLSDLVENPKEDSLLFTIERHRHSKRIKSKEILKLLKNYGYEEYTAPHSYVKFTQKSPFKTDKIEQRLVAYYKEHYPSIQIKKLTVFPRSYTKQIDQEYNVVIGKKSYLKSKDILFIKTEDKKKIFFEYTLYAKVTVMIAKENIKKGTELSRLNVKKKSIILDKFRAIPLQKIEKSMLEAKHNIKKGTTLTKRDVTGLLLVKRGESVHVTIYDANIAISFTAKADTNGKYGESVRVVNSSGSKLMATVTGRNQAEIR